MNSGTMKLTALTLVWAASGIAVAILVRSTLVQWAEDKFGYLEPDIIGVTLLVPPGLVAVGLALLGVRLAGAPGTLARVAVLTGGLGVLAFIATNLPHGVDGLAPRAVPLAIALAVSSVWLVGACWIAVRR